MQDVEIFLKLIFSNDAEVSFYNFKYISIKITVYFNKKFTQKIKTNLVKFKILKTQQKLRLNFERVRSRNIELEKNAKVQKALLTEAQEELKASSVESEKIYKEYINERF